MPRRTKMKQKERNIHTQSERDTVVRATVWMAIEMHTYPMTNEYGLGDRIPRKCVTLVGSHKENKLRKRHAQIICSIGSATYPNIHAFAPLCLISCGQQIDTNMLVLVHPIPWFPRHIRTYNCMLKAARPLSILPLIFPPLVLPFCAFIHALGNDRPMFGLDTWSPDVLLMSPVWAPCVLMLWRSVRSTNNSNCNPRVK